MKPHAPKPSLSPREIEAKLVAKGVQATAQRIALCQYMWCEADHATAEQVKAWADENFPKLSLATVYNTLRTLVSAGLLREYRFPHSESVVYDSNLGDHHHFLDEESGRVFDIDPAQVKVDAKLGREFEVAGIDVMFRGKRRSK